MSVRSFFDTNVLVYTGDASQPDKQAKALGLYRQCHMRGYGVVSTQILQEYFVTATRKLGMEPAIARRKVELFATMDVVVTQVDDILAATDLARLHQLSFGSLSSYAPPWLPIARFCTPKTSSMDSELMGWRFQTPSRTRCGSGPHLARWRSRESPSVSGY